jgi:sensor c-di-GMP phosphodiesterase-like protein
LGPAALDPYRLREAALDFVIRFSHMITSDAIRAGLTQGEFFLEYLPTVSLDEGRCVVAEALVRW